MKTVQLGGRSDRRGFTIVELTVVIAIIAVLFGILFPVFQKVKAKARQISMESDLKQLTRAVELFEQAEHDLPASTQQLAESGILDDSGFVWNADESILTRHHNTDYKYEIASVSQLEIVSCATPIPPYRDGKEIYCSRCTRESPADKFVCQESTVMDDPDAVLARDNREILAQIRILGAITELLAVADDPNESRKVLPFLANADPLSYIQAINSDADNLITKQEFFAFLETRQDDPQVVAVAKSALYDAAILQGLDRSEYEVDLDDISGDARAVFAPVSIELLIHDRVEKRGVANSLSAKIFAATAARERGNIKASDNILEAYRRELWAKAGKSIWLEDALRLETLADVLSPSIESEE